MTQNNITPDLIRAALQHIPANLPRDEWARIGMAIKSEYPDETGKALFADWSATDPASDPKAVKSTWQSIKAGGGVGIGTLLHLAKENGYVMPAQGRPHAMPDKDTAARLDRERVAARQAEKDRRQAAHERAAIEAARLWGEATDEGASPYLERKGVQAFGVRVRTDGGLVVPMRDAEGVLWNVQRIAPWKPIDDRPDKLFLKGGRKSGLWHWCGDPAGAGVLLIAEGYATAASLHEATARPVAVAFDAGNLAHVAQALRAQYPAALLVLCGDDDLPTMATKGHNPGRDKATAAAQAVKGLAVFPEGLPDGGTDFNDLHQAAGLQAVRLIVDGSIDHYEPPIETTQATAEAAPLAAQGPKVGKGAVGKRREPTGARKAAAVSAERGEEGDSGRTFDRFSIDDTGVWFNGIDQEGKPRPPEWICSPLHVEAFTRDQEGSGWGYLLVFVDPLGHTKQWAMPARMLSADGGEYRAALLSMGLRIATTPRARNLLTQYLQTRKPDEFATCTDRIGWHGRAYVLPRETIGDDDARIVFQSESAMENTFRVKGEADQWPERVGLLCAGNSRLVFAVACAFAGPLLRPAGMESGCFHFRGDSSSGKTTALKVAASVYGGPSYVQRWRSTDNALEATAAQHSDCLLILDELAQIDPKTAGDCVYMLANEQGKARATRSGTARPRQSWRVLVLSAGELALSDHMAEGQKRTRTGQETRMADIPADAGAGLGAFENLHGHAGGAAFAKHITHQAQAVYGSAGRAWLVWCTSNADSLKATIRTAADTLAASMIPKHCSGQVERVGARFALVGAAGELAIAAGLTGWQAGESERAARACFAAWLASRGGIGNGEVVAMLRAVRRFLEKHGEGGFTWWHRAADDRSVKTVQRAGYRRMLGRDGMPIKTDSDHQMEYGDRMPAALSEDVSVEYFILPEVFRTEICQGFDHLAVCRVLLDHGCIKPEYKPVPDADKVQRYDTKHRLPGIGPTRCYRITPDILALDL